MFSSAGFVTTLCFLVSFICVAQMMEIPAKKSEDTAALDNELNDNEKRDASADGQSFFTGHCVMCPPGDAGPVGMQGAQGQPGRDGRDQIILGAVDGFIPAAAPDFDDSGKYLNPGAQYVRWGRNDCPESAELVYEGSMGSSHHGHKGSGANFLCMPHDPDFGTNTGTVGGALIYGTEFNTNIPNNQGLLQSEASCAVCLAKEKQSVLVIPGRNTCLGSQDWTTEYTGVLMSSHYTHYRSEFVCVDDNAEGITRTTYNNDESIIYTAESHCSSSGGGLPCPPYVTSHDLLCVVCSI